jgi:predicted molibdopterin-dependent oxidoreductase YjgC
VILLPAKTRYEQDDGGTETTTERRVVFSPELPRTVGEARAEWKILREIAVAAFPERAEKLGCETGWRMREEIARIVPFYEGVQHLKNGGDSFQYGGPHLCAGGVFPTPDGRGRFWAVDVPAIPETKGRTTFLVTTRRGKQFNTLIYAEVDPINGAARDSVLMSPENAGELGLIVGDRIALTSGVGRFEGRVFLAPLAKGCLQVHWPEGNGLLRHGVVDPSAGVPDYNARVTVEKLS